MNNAPFKGIFDISMLSKKTVAMPGVHKFGSSTAAKTVAPVNHRKKDRQDAADAAYDEGYKTAMLDMLYLEQQQMEADLNAPDPMDPLNMVGHPAMQGSGGMPPMG